MHETDARTNFAAVLDAATEDQDEVIITRSGKDAAVVISLRVWESIKETEYLLSTPANAARLAEGVANAKAGRVTARELIEPDSD